MQADLLRPRGSTATAPKAEYQDHLLDGSKPSVAQERQSVVTPLVTQGDEDIELSNKTPSEETLLRHVVLERCPKQAEVTGPQKSQWEPCNDI
jgi:hypothetical protein